MQRIESKNVMLPEILVVKFYSPSRDKIHLRIAERHIIPESDLTLLFMTREAQPQRRVNRNDVKFVTDNQPLSILLRIHTITFYIRRLTKRAPRTGAPNCHTEFSNTGCPVVILNIHSYLS